jgi:hypothetical protein
VARQLRSCLAARLVISTQRITMISPYTWKVNVARCRSSAWPYVASGGQLGGTGGESGRWSDKRNPLDFAA